MNRRTTAVGVIGLGVLAAASAVLLGVPTSGTAVAVEEPIAIEIDNAQNFHGTSITLPAGYVAFTLGEEGQLVPYGDIEKLDPSTLDAVHAQLQAAPPQSVVYIDTESLTEAGLTTALATVTPTSGFSVGSTNQEVGDFLVSLFPQQQGTVASLDVPGVPNANFSYTQSDDEVTWYVTEYVFQFGDATVSVRLSTTDATGETKAEVDQMLAGMTR